MTIGERIKTIRRQKGMTQKEVGDLCGMADSNIRAYELGKGTPKIETLQRIASALGVSVGQLLGLPEQGKANPFWTADLEEKLKQVGCSIGIFEEDAYLWINYPDGTLEVTEEELKELNNSTNAFMRFKLEEMKQARKAQFRSKK